MPMRLLMHNIIMHSRYIIVLLLVMVQYGSPFTPVLDTMEGGAQQRESYTFNYTYTLSDGGGYYGDVEFRRGIITDGTGSTGGLEFGMTPPINGKFMLGGDDTGWGINLKHDLTLGRVSFEPPLVPPGYFAFTWGKDGDTNPYTIFLTQDVAIYENTTLFLKSFTLTGTGYLDGGGHTMTLMPNGFLTPQIGMQTIVIKNLTIEGAGNIVGESGTGAVYLQDVVLHATSERDVTLPLVDLIYRGPNNIIGGGLFDWAKFDNPSSPVYTRISSFSQLYVMPQSRLRLGSYFFAGASLFLFDDASSVLFLDNCSLEISEPGGFATNDYVVFLKGTVYVNGTVTLKANTDGSYLQLGDGVDPANNCNIIILPGSSLVIDSGAKLINKNV